MNQNENFIAVISFAMPLIVLGFVCSLVAGMMKAMAGSSSSEHHSLSPATKEENEEWLEIYRRRHPNVIEGIIQDGVISTRKAMEGVKCVETKLRSKFGDERITRVIVVGSFAYGYQRKKDARGGIAGITSDIDDAERWGRITSSRVESWRQALNNLTTLALGKTPYELVTASEPVNISLKQLEEAFKWDKDLLKTALYSFYSDVDLRIVYSGERPGDIVDLTDRITDQCFWEVTYPHVITYEWVPSEHHSM